MNVQVKIGPTIVHRDGKVLYVRWPDGRLTKDGKRITQAQAEKLREGGM